MSIFNKKQKGFTIVELLVVIAVIGILASVSIVGAGAWRNRVAVNEVTSDLKNAVAAMESARNFGNGYPLTMPTSFTASSGVTLTYTSGDATSFCIEAQSIALPNVKYFIGTAYGKEPKAGTCINGSGGNGQYKNIAVGSDFACRIINNSAYCWGYNAYGQLGNGTTANSYTPVAVSTSGVLSGKTIKSITAGKNHACAIASDDNAYCWGNNWSEGGTLGNGSTTSSSVPVAVSTSGVLSGKTIKSISAGGDSVCAIASDDKAYCWGYNYQGQLGNGSGGTSTAYSTVPSAVTATGVLSDKSIKSIGVSDVHGCMAASDDKVYCWGNGSGGGLGNGTNGTSYTPVAVDSSGVLAGKSITLLTVMSGTTCVVASDNNGYCWGNNSNGRLGINGNDYLDNRNVPVAVVTSGELSGKTLKSLGQTNGATHVCSIASDNKAYCWGNNREGQLGVPMSGPQVCTGSPSWPCSKVPIAVTATGGLSGKTILSIASGIAGSCAITSNNLTYCWGYAVTNGTGSNSDVPLLISNP